MTKGELIVATNGRYRHMHDLANEETGIATEKRKEGDEAKAAGDDAKAITLYGESSFHLGRASGLMVGMGHLTLLTAAMSGLEADDV